MPRNVGVSFPRSLVTYVLRCIVPIILAKVEGRPIPCASSSLTREASVNRAGGLVICSSADKSLQVSVWPLDKSGRIVS